VALVLDQTGFASEYRRSSLVFKHTPSPPLSTSVEVSAFWGNFSLANLWLVMVFSLPEYAFLSSFCVLLVGGVNGYESN